MRWSKADLPALLALAVGALVLGLERAPLAHAHRKITEKHDVYLLPPSQQTLALSLGYRAALADFIFGHVLVSTGVHLSEKRVFEFAAPYLETVNALDPKFRAPYRYADAIITLQAVKVPEDAYRQTRAILLRGTREFPNDQELWAAAGGFLVYLAAPQLQDPKEQADFRQEGTRLLARACELIGSTENLPYQCLSAARLLSEAGNQAASQAFLQKLLAMSDDPELRARATAGLAQMGIKAHARKIEQARRDDLPFVSRDVLVALGPRFDPAACAGKPADVAEHACSTSFRERLPAPGSD